jgi:hypothetical protein
MNNKSSQTGYFIIGIRTLMLITIILVLVSCNPTTQSSPIATHTQTLPTTITPILPTNTITQQPTYTQTPSLVPMSDFMKGFGYGAGWSGFYSSITSDWILENTVKPLGVTWIKIQPACNQETDHSTQISCLDKNVPTYSDISHVVDKAHRLGLRVLFEPAISVKDMSNGGWAGTIGRSFNDRQWQDWFTSFDQMILNYARISEINHIDYFSVGSELRIASSRESEFRNLIAQVRKIYHGPIIYSSDQELEWNHIQWWDAVDAIGIHPYILRIPTSIYEPTVEDVMTAWRPITDRLSELSDKWNRPIVITEIGYESRHGISHDYMYGLEHPKLDTHESAVLYQGFVNAFKDKPWFRGLFWWVINSWTNFAEPTTFLFNPYKPEVDVVRAFYGAPPEPTPPPFPQYPSSFKNIQDIYIDGLNPNWSNYPPNGDPANIDFSQSKVALSGNAIRVNLVAELIFSRDPYIDFTNYQWLEFYVYVSPDAPYPPMLHVSLRDSMFHCMPYTVDLTNSQFIQGGQLERGQWQQVDIPIVAMGPLLESIKSITIVNDPMRPPMVIYVDNIRLLGN